jgi:hypothetical protein
MAYMMLRLVDLEPSAHVWWLHVSVVICLGMWAVEILIAGDDDDEFVDGSDTLKLKLKLGKAD